jgi:hypothetical protein
MEEGTTPVRECQRKLKPEMKEVVRREVIRLLDAGIIYLVFESKWVSLVHCVPKKGEFTVVPNKNNELIPTRTIVRYRMCIDFRKFNKETWKDHYPLPFINQMLERLATHTHFCYPDGYFGFSQIAVHPDDQEKMTFTYPFGMYAYRRMPFGLCNAPATFQRCMAAIFAGFVEEIMEVVMDDFSTYGTSFDDCLHNLNKVLQGCEDTNLVLNWEKCRFMVNEGIVLGHKISEKGIEVDRAKIDAIEKLPCPRDIKGIRSFLGHASFYRCFINNFSSISKPLTNRLQKSAPFNFDKECISAFEQLKQALIMAPIIKLPKWDEPFEVIYETDDNTLSDALAQHEGNKLNVIYYASHTLNDAQKNYAKDDRELYAMIFACEKFRSYITETKDRVYTDHQAIKDVLAKKDSKPRWIWWALLLQNST